MSLRRFLKQMETKGEILHVEKSFYPFRSSIHHEEATIKDKIVFIREICHLGLSRPRHRFNK